MASYNGTTIKPSNIEMELDIQGEEIRDAADGITHIIRGDGSKRAWTLTWSKVTGAIRDMVAGFAALTGSYTFVDDRGVSYTVIRQIKPFSSSFAFIGDDGMPYYNVTFKIQEES